MVCSSMVGSRASYAYGSCGSSYATFVSPLSIVFSFTHRVIPGSRRLLTSAGERAVPLAYRVWSSGSCKIRGLETSSSRARRGRDPGRPASEEMRRLLDRAVAASSNGIVITDPNAPDDPIVYVNPAFEKISGYAVDEVRGRNCRVLQADDRGQSALDELRGALREKRECRVVLR